MQIGQLANSAGVAVDTVRYYERQGLLPPPQRRDSGYRRYGEEDVLRLRIGLKELIDRCPGHGELATCPILAALSED